MDTALGAVCPEFVEFDRNAGPGRRFLVVKTKLMGLALLGAAFLLSQGCTTGSTRSPEAMEMAADLYPPVAAGKPAESIALPAWVESYRRSSTGTSVVVLRGGIRAVRVRSSAILIYEQVGGPRNSWLVVVFDARSRSILKADEATGSPVLVGRGPLANADGSVDVHFGLQPLPGKENNWVRTGTDVPW